MQDETAWNQFYTKYRAVDPILLRRVAVKIIGSELIARHGRDILRSCAKLHFKTASEL